MIIYNTEDTADKIIQIAFIRRGREYKTEYQLLY